MTPEYHPAMFEMVAGSRKPDYFVTLVTRQPFTPERLGQSFRHLVNVMDHNALGRHWPRFEERDRYQYVAVPEQDTAGKWHLHVLLRRPNQSRRSGIDLGQFIWTTWAKATWGVSSEADLVELRRAIAAQEMAHKRQRAKSETAFRSGMRATDRYVPMPTYPAVVYPVADEQQARSFVAYTLKSCGAAGAEHWFMRGWIN